MDLITDRTQADVDRWKALRDKGLAGMSSAEQAEWLGEMKGRYAHTDMNRVENAVAEVARQLRNLGYDVPSLFLKTDWTVRSVPTREDFDRYFGNVETLRGVLPLPATTPKTPTTETRLNYAAANDLEKILVDVDTMVQKLVSARYYAGDIFAGDV
jgi:hypothetical protein